MEKALGIYKAGTIDDFLSHPPSNIAQLNLLIMVTTTTHFGGTASSILTPKVGHGTMTMTVRGDELSDEQLFAAIRHTIAELPQGAKAFLISGEFYASPPRSREANLDLIKRYFDRYPEDKDKVCVANFPKSHINLGFTGLPQRQGRRHSCTNSRLL